MEKLLNNTLAAYGKFDGDNSAAEACDLAGLVGDDKVVVERLLNKVAAAYEMVENSYDNIDFDDDEAEPLSYDEALESLGVNGDERVVALRVLDADLALF